MSLYSLPGQNYIYTLQYSWPRRFFHLTRQGWTFSCRWVAGPTVSLQPCSHWKKLEKVVCPLFYQDFLTNHLRFPDGSNSPINEAEKLPQAPTTMAGTGMVWADAAWWAFGHCLHWYWSHCARGRYPSPDTSCTTVAWLVAMLAGLEVVTLPAMSSSLGLILEVFLKTLEPSRDDPLDS